MKRAILTLASLLAALPAGDTKASMRDQLDQMFNGMSTYTRPGLYESQSRGVISGGSFSVRTRSANNVSLFNFSPPTLNAGCGGIDAYMGSFSWVSEEALIDLARAIASDAAGYAFEVALSSICPTCASTMDKLRNYINKLNSQLGSSCDMARMLVDRTTTNGMWEGARWEALDNAAQRGGSWLDNYRDEYDARRNVGNLAQDIASDNPRIINRNPLAEVARLQNLSNWFRGGRAGESVDEFGMDVLSLFGMVGFCTPAPNGLPQCPMFDEADHGQMRELDYAPTLDLAHLVYGVDSPYSPHVEAEVYRCEDELCLDVYLLSYNDVGMAARILDAYLGSSESRGIIHKLTAIDGTPLTEFERAMVVRSGDMAAITRNLMLTSEDRARGFIETWAPVMAIEMMYGFARETYRGLLSGLRATPGIGNEIAAARLRERMLELEHERQHLVSVAATQTAGMLEHYDLMKKTLVDVPSFGNITVGAASSYMTTRN